MSRVIQSHCSNAVFIKYLLKMCEPLTYNLIKTIIFNKEVLFIWRINIQFELKFCCVSAEEELLQLKPNLCVCVLWLPLPNCCSLTLCCSLMAPCSIMCALSCCCVWVTWCDKSSVSSRSDLKLRVRILIDGTLIIFRVKPEDAGKYTCSPSNSLGISPSASAYLTVQCECYRGNKV